MVGALLLLRKDKQGRKSVETTKENIHKAQDGIQRFKRQRAAKSMETRAKNRSPGTGNSLQTVEHTATDTLGTVPDRGTIKTAERVSQRAAERTAGHMAWKTPRSAAREMAEKRIKQSAHFAERKTVKTMGKGTAKTAVKTSRQAAKTAQKTAQR